MASNKPTIKDVAKKANVSVATVSRVLNNTGYVNEQTRELVVQAIKELGYVPNELARSLYRKQSKIIGMIVPHLSTYFFAELIETMEETVASSGFKLMVFNAREDLSREEKMFQVLSQYNVDGLMLVTHLPHIENYLNLNIPMISIDHKLNDDIPSISSDNVTGGILAAETLIKNGCKNLLHLRGPSVLLTVQERSMGFEKVLKKHNLPHTMLDLDFRKPDINAIQKFIANNPKTDGIFCHSDTMALTAIRAIHLLGKKVPEDIQVIGFDNIELTELITPSLTTIEQSIKAIANRATEILLKMINKEEVPVQHQILPVSMVHRESTKKR